MEISLAMRRIISAIALSALSVSAVAADDPGYYLAYDYGVMEIDAEAKEADLKGGSGFSSIAVGYRYHDELSWEIEYGQSGSDAELDGEYTIAPLYDAKYLAAKLNARTKGKWYWAVELGFIHAMIDAELANGDEASDDDTDISLGTGLGFYFHGADISMNYSYGSNLSTLSLGLDYKF